MARFKYQAKNTTGQVVNGELDAKDQQEALIRLRAQHLIPVRLVVASSTSSSAKSNSFFSKKVNPRDLQIFTRQFATLINAGIPVMDSLKILSEGLRPGILKEASSQVKTSIEGGRRLSDSMAQVPNVFDRLYCNMIQAGEEAGILDGILQRLASYMEKSGKIKGQVKGALVYPAVILVVAAFVIAGILTFVIPKFTEFFVSSGGKLPFLTQLVVNLSHSLTQNWYIYLSIAIFGPILIFKYLQTPDGKHAFERFIFKAPLFGEVVQKASIARLTRTLGTLLSSGVGLIEAIDIAARTSGNVVVEQALLRCKESVTSGRTFAAPLAREKAFPEMVVQMISIGEQSGTLDVMLGKIADFYEDEVETAVKAMTSLIEPLLMVVLGGVIAVLVVAMYLPIFNMAGTIQ